MFIFLTEEDPRIETTTAKSLQVFIILKNTFVLWFYIYVRNLFTYHCGRD